MSTIDDALFSILSTDAGVTALFKTGTDTRIHPVVIPQGERLPAAAIQQISGLRVHAMQGPSGLTRPRFQITIKAVTNKAVTAAAAAIRQALDGYYGTVSGVRIDSALIDHEFETYNLDDRTYVVRQDYMVWHTEDP